MSNKLTIIIMLLIAAVLPMSAAKKHATKNSSTPAHVAAQQAQDADEMNLASVSKTNPYEIVPAAGMEIFSDITDDGVDFAMVEDMLGFARKFMGVRYVHGGRSPKGFDCSGFTSYVFSQFGIELSPSSKVQYSQGKKISRDEVQPGDLLFFTGRSSRSRTVGHVGLVVDADPVSGEITFIHAARGGIKSTTSRLPITPSASSAPVAYSASNL